MKPLLFKRMFALLIVIALTAVDIITTQTAFADTAALTAENQKYYASIMIRDCLAGLPNKGSIDKATIDSGSITQPGGPVGVTKIGRAYNSGSQDGTLSCGDKNATITAVHNAGYADVNAWLTAIGYTIGTSNQVCGLDTNYKTVCTGGSQVYTISGPDSMNSKMPPQSPAAQYYAYQTMFNSNCTITPSATGAFTQRQIVEEPAGSKQFVTKDVKVDFPSTTVSTGTYNSPGGSSSATISGSTKTITNYDYNGQTTTCGDLLNQLNNLTPAALQYSKDNPNSPLTTASLINSSATGTGAPGAASTCRVEGIGWIVCPVTTFLGNIADGATNILNSFFLIDAATIFNPSSAAYTAWQQMLGYANIIFIVAFILIIISQVTSVGISNYGIKKLLPKLIIVAILVNVSFFICALAVDASNVLGVSLAKTLNGVVTFTTPTTDDWTASATPVGGIIATALVLGSAAAAAYFALAAIIGIVLSVVIIGVTMVAMLAIRQGLIVLLVVFSPLAFATMLLPNTEGIYKKWFGMFKSLLLLFPIAGLLYGAGKLTGDIVMHTSGFWLVELMGAALPILMLVAVYKVFTGTMSALEGVGGFVKGLSAGTNKIGSAANGFAKNKIDSSIYGQFRKYRDQQANMRRAQIQGGAYTGKGGKFNPNNWRSGFNGAINNSRITGNFGNKRIAAGAAAISSQDGEYLKNAGIRLDEFQYDDPTHGKSTLSQDQMMDLALGNDAKDSSGNVVMSAKSVDTHTRRAAIERAAKLATVKQAELLASATTGMGASERKTISQALAQSSVLQKAPHLAGKALGDMQAGTFNLTGSALGAVKTGKIKAETLASLDENSAKTIFDAVNSTAGGSDERKLLKAAADEMYKSGSRLTEKVVAGSDLDVKLKAMQTL